MQRVSEIVFNLKLSQSLAFRNRVVVRVDPTRRYLLQERANNKIRIVLIPCQHTFQTSPSEIARIGPIINIEG